MRSAQTIIQDRIDIEQWLADIEYGLRSIGAAKAVTPKWAGVDPARNVAGVHADQVTRAITAATVVLDCEPAAIRFTGGTVTWEEKGRAKWGSGIEGRLKQARGIFRELLADAKAELKDAYGGVRQIKLALDAQDAAHEYGLAA